MDCIVLAGGETRPDDPLFEYTKGGPKALIRLGEQTMLEHVVRALHDAVGIDEVIVVGLNDLGHLDFQRPIHAIPDQGGLISNALAGVAWARQYRNTDTAVLLCSADIPAINGAIVDAHLELCQPLDSFAYYTFVPKESLEARFPRARRTYIRLRDGKVAGGDLVVVRTELAEHSRSLWDALASGRKHPWKIAGIVGFGMIVRLLLGQLSINQIEARARRKLGRPVRILLSPYAEVAMDADKPHQVDFLRKHLSSRGDQR